MTGAAIVCQGRVSEMSRGERYIHLPRLTLHTFHRLLTSHAACLSHKSRHLIPHPHLTYESHSYASCLSLYSYTHPSHFITSHSYPSFIPHTSITSYSYSSFIHLTPLSTLIHSHFIHTSLTRVSRPSIPITNSHN